MADEESGLEMEVKVDGMPLGLVPFVREMMAAAIVGMITTLRGAENAREIEIRVRRKD